MRILILLVAFFLVACGPKKAIFTKKKKTNTKTENVVVKVDPKAAKPEALEKQVTSTPRKRSSVDIYIDSYAQIAMTEMRKSKIPASITLAQGILESGSGNGRLAKEANNHFGIKCHGWKGAKIYHDDDEDQECFRKYKAASTSYKDHSEFLTGRRRYANLFKLKQNDYRGWAKGLKAAGYATDRKYPQKLISLIERYELFEYDNRVLGKVILSQYDKSSDLIIHNVIKGDTLYSLSRKYGVTVYAIKTINKLTNNNLAIGQVLIIKSE